VHAVFYLLKNVLKSLPMNVALIHIPDCIKQLFADPGNLGGYAEHIKGSFNKCFYPAR
jgi:hypothetical protein